jgi:hypothetical protein
MLAEPLLWREIDITSSPRRLFRLSRHILNSSVRGRGSCVARWIRTIEVTSPIYSAQDMDSLHIIFMRVVNLRQLDMPHGVFPGLLACMPPNVSSSLRILVVNFSNQESGDSLALLSGFTSLRLLDITFTSPVKFPIVLDGTPRTFPSLRSLTWTREARDDPEQSLMHASFIASYQAPHLESVSMTFGNMPQKGTSQLGSFFRAHPSIEDVTVILPEGPRDQLLPHITSNCLRLYILTGHLSANAISPHVHELFLYAVFGREGLGHFLQALTHRCQSDPSLGLEFVAIRLICDPEDIVSINRSFFWDEWKLHCNYMGDIVQHAILLENSGIFLLDEDDSVLQPSTREEWESWQAHPEPDGGDMKLVQDLLGMVSDD